MQSVTKLPRFADVGRATLFFGLHLFFEALVSLLSCGVLGSAGQGICEFLATEYVDHAFEVVGCRGQADFGLCSSQSAQQQARVAEDAIFQGSEGVFDGRSPEPHGFRRGPLLHSLQGVVVKVAADRPPGARGALAFERT